MAKTILAVACKSGDLEEALRESIRDAVSRQLDEFVDSINTRNGFDDEPIPYGVTPFGWNARVTL